MKPACALLVLLLLFVNSLAQTSTGAEALPSKVVVSEWNSDCSMSDILNVFLNDRQITCTAGQSHFFNGEIRYVDWGTGMYASKTPYNGYELTSCACSQNGTWTRTMENVTTAASIYIEWTWKFYARRADCSLELKRDLSATGCWFPLRCSCLEGTVCNPENPELCDVISPIVIDLDGDGLRLTNRQQGVAFDLDGNDEYGQIPWLGEDGWLVLDDYEDGVVRNGRQFFGDRSAQVNLPGEQSNGYVALRLFDDNRDNLIDSRDGVWRLLGVWRDLSHNGVSELGEVVSLDMLGITALSLDYRKSRRRDRYGNELRYRARVHWASGAHTSSWDVFLTVD